MKNKYYCLDCKGEIGYVSFKYGSCRCRSCSAKERYKNPKNNPNYKHGNNVKNKKCIDCGICNIHVQAVRCLECEHRHHSSMMKGKNNPNYGKPRSKETREKISKSKKGQSSGRKNPMYGKLTHGKWGEYKGIKMRSSWEIKYAKYLDSQNIKWEYESKTFDLGETTYTPDFYIPRTCIFVEVKGYWREDAIKKFDIFKKKYPNCIIDIVDKYRMKELELI